MAADLDANRCIIVTGAASGIGLETTRVVMRDYPDHLVLGVDRHRVDIPTGEGCGRLVEVICDLGTDQGVAQVMAAAEQSGTAVGLVNCAALQFPSEAGMSNLDDLDYILRVNLLAPLRLSQWIVSEARHRNVAAAVVNVSSVHAELAEPGNMPYTTSKGGLEAGTRTLAVEYARYGIRLNVVRPGAVDTAMNSGLTEATRSRISAGIPMARFGRAAEIAQVISFLLSEKASYVTGAVWTVDGGLSANPPFQQ